MRSTQRMWHIGSIAFFDRRVSPEPSTEELVKTIQLALELLSRAGCDAAVKEMVSGILASDTSDWQHYGFGLCEGSFTKGFGAPIPLAMRLLWSSTFRKGDRKALLGGSRADALELQRLAYHAVDAFAWRCEDPAFWRQFAKDTFAPEAISSKEDQLSSA